MKTQVITKRGKGKTPVSEERDRHRASYAAYGDRTPICINAGCIMRKQATCFGFEGCPGFKAKG